MAPQAEAPAPFPPEAMGFFKLPVDPVHAHLCDWLKEIKGSRGIAIRSRPIGGRLREALQSLKPLSTREIERYLLMSTQTEWTAYLDNLRFGTDPSAIAYLSRRMGCMSVYFYARPLQREKTPVGDVYTGAMVFTLYGPHAGSSATNTIRDVRVFADVGGWVFRETGAPLPFENTAAYQAKRMEDRFTMEMLEAYLQSMGIRAFDETFYRPASARLIELAE